jgi:hypothetical protein
LEITSNLVLRYVFGEKFRVDWLGGGFEEDLGDALFKFIVLYFV